MTHEEILKGELADAYVRQRLSASERIAFEDHFFACDECFEQVEILKQFSDGVRDAAESGLLPPVRTMGGKWLAPALVLAWAASIALAIFAGWTFLIERPRLQAEIAAERHAVEESRTRLSALERDLNTTRLALAKPPVAQGNLPLVMLEASRGSAPTTVALPQDATQLAIWVEPPPSAAGTLYRLEIIDGAGQTVNTVDHLARNSYGALAVSIPAKVFSTGISYLARLYAMSGPKPNLSAEYRFAVRR